MDIFILNGHDYSDYVVSISLTRAPILDSIVDLDGNTHAGRRNGKTSFTVEIGLIPDNMANQMDADVDLPQVSCNINGKTYIATGTSANRTSQYCDGESIYWDVSVSGVEA